MFRSPQIVLFSQDVSRAAAFYAGLGFTEAFRVPAEGPPIHVDLVLDGYRIGIASVDSIRSDPIRSDHGLHPMDEGQRAAVILWTDDTRSAFESLTSRGCPPLAPPHPWLDRLLIAWVADPDGHPIQVVQNL